MVCGGESEDVWSGGDWRVRVSEGVWRRRINGSVEGRVSVYRGGVSEGVWRGK